MSSASPLFVSLIVLVSRSLAYTPSWDSLDSRPLPAWYDQARIGIFIHWGVYSVPSHASELFWWFWQGGGPPRNPAAPEYIGKCHHSFWTYANFAPDFTADLFNPTDWAELFVASGVKYVVLTAKHHDGFTLWPSPTSFNWNSVDVGPNRDLVGELVEAVRAAGLRFGVHYSLDEWFNEMLRKDKASGYTQNLYSVSKAQPELHELVIRYKPDIIRVVGENAPDTYWNSTNFLAWLYNDSPVSKDVVVNDRWGIGSPCKHGDVFNCGDKFNPGYVYPHKFENVFSLDKLSFGYRRTMNLENVMTIEEVLIQIVSTIACNGNVLINIGARSDGTFPTIFEERLRQMGRWLEVNQEAVFGTQPWLSTRDSRNPDVWYTKKENTIYAFVTKWPGKMLELTSINTKVVRSISQVEILGSKPTPRRFILSDKAITIELPCVTCAQPVKSGDLLSAIRTYYEAVDSPSGYQQIALEAMLFIGVILIPLCGFVSTCEHFSGPTKYEPTWASLATRPMPTWYDEAKIGILVHMGVYSVPAYSSEWFWWFWKGKGPPVDSTVKEFVDARYPHSWTYPDFARGFTAEFFKQCEWAILFREAGAKYVILTAKHHEGFTLWPSPHSPNWNSMQVGPKRDIVNDLAAQVRANGLKFGVYYSLYEWFNPLWLEDKKNEFATYTYSQYKTQMELRDLVERYSPDIIWADGDFAPDTYWNSTYFLAWLYTHRENTVVNDRWGFGTSCRHGDFYTCGNRFNPGYRYVHKFENVFSLDNVSWGYRRTLDLHCVKTIEEILFEIVSTVACNGNVLINFGARSDGTIPPIFEERLRQMGDWFKINSEAIHGSRPWDVVRDDWNRDVWYTKKPSVVYAFITKWPVDQADEVTSLSLHSVNRSMVAKVTQVWMLGAPPVLLKHAYSVDGLNVELPCFTFENPAKWVWVLKILV